MSRHKSIVRGFPDRLCTAIERSGLSINTISAAVGITRWTLIEYTVGNFAPTASILARLCSTLHVSADWLLGLKAESK
jgi:ribosome-binding protein aMBF1 (putative translation factor)